MGDTEFLIPRTRNDELYHHGTKGMKWGVRRYQNYDGSIINSKPKEKKLRSSFLESYRQKSAAKKTYKKEHSPKTVAKSVQEMSDDELRRRLNRINMEEQYKNAIARQNPRKSEKARKFLSDMSDKAARSITEKAINKVSDQLVNKIFSSSKTDSKTQYRFDDISKVGDDVLNKAVKRAEQENKLAAYLDKIDERKKKQNGGS